MKKEEEDKKPAKRITKPSDKTPEKIKEQKQAAAAAEDNKGEKVGSSEEEDRTSRRLSFDPDAEGAAAAEQAAAAAEVDALDENASPPNDCKHGEYSDSDDDEEWNPEDESDDDSDEVDTIPPVEFKYEHLLQDKTNAQLSNTVHTLLGVMDGILGTVLFGEHHILCVVKSDKPEHEIKNYLRFHTQRLKDMGKAVIYYIIRTKKTGRTTNGKKRWKRYENDYGDDEIIVIFDYDYADDTIINETLPEVVKTVQNHPAVSLKDYDIKTLDMEQVKDLESNGNLNLYFRLIMHSLCNEDGPIGGAYRVQGNGRAINLQFIESVAQHHTNDTSESAAHEQFFCPGSGWVDDSDTEVKSDLDVVERKLITKVGKPWIEKRDLKNGESFTVSWAPDIPHDDVAATCIEYDAIIGEKDTRGKKYWRDMTDDVCSYKNTDTGRIEPYSAEKYYDDDACGEMRAGHRKVVRANKKKKKGDLTFMNKNSLSYLKSKKRTPDDKDDIDDSLEAFVVREGYQLLHRYLEVAIYIHKGIGEPSIIVIHPPFCVVLFSGQDSTEAGKWSKIKHQARRAKMAHFMQGLVQYFIGQGKQPMKTHKMVLGNFLYAFVMRIYLLKNLHVHAMVAALFAKNMLWTYDNLFKLNSKGKPIYHGLAASKYMNLRQQNKAANPGKFDKHWWIRRDIQYCLSYIGCFGNTLNDQVDKAVKIIQTFKESTVSNRRGSDKQRKIRERLFQDYVKQESDVGGMIRERIEAGIASHEKEVAAGLEEANATLAAKRQKGMSRLPSTPE